MNNKANMRDRFCAAMGTYHNIGAGGVNQFGGVDKTVDMSIKRFMQIVRRRNICRKQK